jgi:hypothetical protein
VNPRRPPHPWAGLAIGAALLAGWLGAMGAGMASDASTDAEDRAERKSAVAETPPARPGRAGPGYDPPRNRSSR